jgi:hypothetical protein
MKCMSCGQYAAGTDLKRFNHLFVCSFCHELAERAQREIDKVIDQARQGAANWLENHILGGGLRAGGNGHGARSAVAAGLSLSVPTLSEMWSEKEAGRTGIPTEDR